jgi:hypothetical protein
MISTPDRQRAIALIEEARARGARLEAACRELGITASPEISPREWK